MAIIKQVVQPVSGDPWVSHKLDRYCFAAGSSVTAFGLVTVAAVAVFAGQPQTGLVWSRDSQAVAYCGRP